MANIIFNEDSHLEMGLGSKRKMLVGCPNCKIARAVSINWVGSVCTCGKYFNKDMSIPIDDCVGSRNDSTAIDPNYIKVKENAEKAAYEWKDKQKAKGTLGTRSHEPGKVKRTW